jgi:hypothetical protein
MAVDLFLLQSLRSVPVPAVSRHSAVELGGLLAGQRQAARDADWAAMLSGSLTLLGAGEGHGTAVRAVRASTGALAALGTGAAEALREGLEQLAARADHGAQAQGIREQLQATNPDLAVRAGPLLDQVAAGVIDAGPFEEATQAAAGLAQAPGTEFEAALCVAATTRSARPGPRRDQHRPASRSGRRRLRGGARRAAGGEHPGRGHVAGRRAGPVLGVRGRRGSCQRARRCGRVSGHSARPAGPVRRAAGSRGSPGRGAAGGRPQQ